MVKQVRLDKHVIVFKNPLFIEHHEPDGCDCYKVLNPWATWAQPDKLVLCPVTDGLERAKKLAYSALNQLLLCALEEEVTDRRLPEEPVPDFQEIADKLVAHITTPGYAKASGCTRAQHLDMVCRSYEAAMEPATLQRYMALAGMDDNGTTAPLHQRVIALSAINQDITYMQATKLLALHKWNPPVL